MVNKNAILQNDRYKLFNPESLPKKSGLTYIPLYSPVTSPVMSPVTKKANFEGTSEAASKSASPHHAASNYQTASSNSSSIASDTEDDMNKCKIMNRSRTFISRFLELPTKPSDQAQQYNKSGRVLTAPENLALLHEKEEQKKLKKQEKEKRVIAIIKAVLQTCTNGQLILLHITCHL